MHECVCVRACVRAYAREYVRARICTSESVCVCVCACVSVSATIKIEERGGKGGDRDYFVDLLEIVQTPLR